MQDWINKNSDKIEMALLIVIILLQVITRLVAGNAKAYLHIDESYSYGLMNYDIVDIINNEDFYNNWHNKHYYENYLTISEEEKWDFSPVYENQKNDVHPPLYYLLLRITALLRISDFSKWTGIGLNILIFVITSIMVYKISKIIFKDKLYAVLVVLINGFTIASIETTMFIRMYALNALNLLIIAYIHMRNYNKEKLEIKDLIWMSILIILGALTHYYYLIFVFVLYIMYMVHFIKWKNKINGIRYTLSMVVSGIIYLMIFPYSFEHIFMGYRGQGVASNLSSFDTMWNSLGGYIRILDSQVFNSVLVFGIIFVSIYVLIKIVKNKIIKISFRNRELFLLLTPTLVYFITIACVSPYQEIRYIMPICPAIVITIMYLVKKVLQRMLSPQKTFVAMILVFFMMIFIPINAKTKIEYIYSDMETFIQQIESESDLPTLYILDKDNNRFMDDLYLFTKIDKSYILDSKLFSKEKIQEIFEKVDTEKGIRIIISEGLPQVDYIYTIKDVLNKDSFSELKRLNACNVYIIEKDK